MEELDTQGVFWIPDTPDIRIPGQLSFTSKEGAQLSLLRDVSSQGFEQLLVTSLPSSQPTILGLTEEGERLTLWNSLCTGVSATQGRIRTERFHVHMVIMGQHCGGIEDSRFDRAIIEFTFLSEWVGVTGFRSPDTDVAEDGGRSLAKYVRPETSGLELPGGRLEISVLLGRAASATTRKFEENSSFTIRSEQPLTMTEWQDRWIEPLRGFLDLATCSLNAVTRLQLADSTKQESGLAATVLYQPLLEERTKPSYSSTDGFLFTLSDIEGRAGDVIGNWIKDYTEMAMRPVHQRVSLDLQGRWTYGEQRFLNLTNALEAYHRRRFPGDEMPAEEHEARVEEILGLAPADHKAWLKERLKWSNQITFRKRVRFLVARFCEPGVFLGRTERQFVSDVVDWRNHWTHLDPDAKAPGYNGVVLIVTNEILSLLLRCCLLEDCGFSPKDSLERSKKSRGYRDAVVMARNENLQYRPSSRTGSVAEKPNQVIS